MKKSIQLQPIVIPMDEEEEEYQKDSGQLQNNFKDNSQFSDQTNDKNQIKKNNDIYQGIQFKSDTLLIEQNNPMNLIKQHESQKLSKFKKINFQEIDGKKPKHENTFIARDLNIQQIAQFKRNKTMHLSVQNVSNNYSSNEEKMDKSEQIDNSSTKSYSSNPYKLKPKIFYNKSIKLNKARPGTPRYQGNSYGYENKKINFRHIGYDTPFQPVYYADNFDEPNKGSFQYEQELNLNTNSNKHWVIVHGLEQPKLIKAVCKQFVDVEDDLTHEQKEEMWNGWVADFVETHSNPTLNDIDSDQLYMVVKHLYLVKKEDSISIVVKHFSFVAGQNYLLTFLEDGKENIDGEIINTTQNFEHYMEEIMNKIYRNDKKYCKSNVYFILFKLIDRIVENYQNMLRQFSTQVIDVLDNEVIENPNSSTLKRLHNARTEMLEIKYATKPFQNMIKRILKRQSFYNKDLLNYNIANDLNLQHLQSQSQMGTLVENQIDNLILKSQDLRKEQKHSMNLKNYDQTRNPEFHQHNNQMKLNKKSSHFNTNLNENNEESSYPDSRSIKARKQIIQKIDKYDGQFMKMIYDEISEVNGDVSYFLEILQNQLNIYLSYTSNDMAEQSQKTNEVMKFLTLITSIFIPLSFLTGLYGMNFENMPELTYENGYFILLGLMGFLVISMVIFFYKKQWLNDDYAIMKQKTE